MKEMAGFWTALHKDFEKKPTQFKNEVTGIGDWTVIGNGGMIMQLTNTASPNHMKCVKYLRR